MEGIKIIRMSDRSQAKRNKYCVSIYIKFQKIPTNTPVMTEADRGKGGKRDVLSKVTETLRGEGDGNVRDRNCSDGDQFL